MRRPFVFPFYVRLRTSIPPSTNAYGSTIVRVTDGIIRIVTGIVPSACASFDAEAADEDDADADADADDPWRGFPQRTVVRRVLRGVVGTGRDDGARTTHDRHDTTRIAARVGVCRVSLCVSVCMYIHCVSCVCLDVCVTAGKEICIFL